MTSATRAEPPLPFDNSYARLPARLYVRLAPTPVVRPELIELNRSLATFLGLDADWLASMPGIELLAGNRVVAGSEPLAMAYAGHQFGHWVAQLGDGRALLLGELLGQDRQRYDLQLKGSGPTPFSRAGDGRAALGPVLREYLVSEAMAALAIPTTRALAAVTTGEPVVREALLPGAILTRVARSHLRVGTFQYFAARDDLEALALLTDYALARLYPERVGEPSPALALLEAVVERQADLVAAWLAVGFIHGVMNTDNCSISGETLDYGPCAFMDNYHPETVFSSIDRHGRYAYANQPRIAQWNLARLAHALLGLIDRDEARAAEQAQTIIDRFPALFEAAWLARMRAKLGLSTVHEHDRALIDDLLTWMAQSGADFTLTFRQLGEATGLPPEWRARWRERLAGEGSDPEASRGRRDAVNPLYIPRNHQVEAVIAAALEGDLTPFHRLLEVVTQPWQTRAEWAGYARPPRPDEVVRETFCGT